MMVSTPLISPGNRKLIGFNKPVLRIYKHYSAGMILINKAGCRLAGLSKGDSINIHYTSYGLSLFKHLPETGEGYILKMDNGRLRFYVSKNEINAMMSWFKSNKNSAAFIIDDRFESRWNGVLYAHKLTEVVEK